MLTHLAMSVYLETLFRTRRGVDGIVTTVCSRTKWFRLSPLAMNSLQRLV